MSHLGNIQAFKPSTTQSKAYTGTSARVDNAFATGIHVVRILSTTDCFVEFAGTPTATTSDVFLPAYTPEYFMVDEGQKVAAIQSATGGTLYVTEMTK